MTTVVAKFQITLQKQTWISQKPKPATFLKCMDKITQITLKFKTYRASLRSLMTLGKIAWHFKLFNCSPKFSNDTIYNLNSFPTKQSATEQESPLTLEVSLRLYQKQCLEIRLVRQTNKVCTNSLFRTLVQITTFVFRRRDKTLSDLKQHTASFHTFYRSRTGIMETSW